jgi:hypothetical protein
MGAENVVELQSLDQFEEMRRADKRLSELQQAMRDAERQLDDAWTDLARLENEAPRRRDVYYKRLSEAQQAVGEAESNLRVAAELTEEAKQERKEIHAKVCARVQSSLIKERRRRVEEAIPIIEKALQANQAIHDIERMSEELLPEGTALSGSLAFDASFHALTVERFRDWLHFLRAFQILDESAASLNEPIAEV